MAKDLNRNDWLKAARLALLRGGVEAVQVEKLARSLDVTKGSFYWHFKDRSELLELLLREWEDEITEVISTLSRESPEETARTLIRVLAERASQSEEGDVPSDAAIFSWASVSPKVARRVNKAEEKRIKLLMRVIGHSARVELAYLAWLGFVARGQRMPASRKRFPQIARMMLELLLPGSDSKSGSLRLQNEMSSELQNEAGRKSQNRAGSNSQAKQLNIDATG